MYLREINGFVFKYLDFWLKIAINGSTHFGDKFADYLKAIYTF